jgi:hypothetical protein
VKMIQKIITLFAFPYNIPQNVQNEAREGNQKGRVYSKYKTNERRGAVIDNR